MAPEAFRKADISEIRGIYVPAYLYCATAHAQYRVEIGEHYKKRDRNGKQKTRTEWRPLSSRYSAYVNDHVVTASRGLKNAELDAIEPFDLSGLRRYTSKLISGWAAEEASYSPSEVVTVAQHEALVACRERIRRFLPGDSNRNLHCQTELRQAHLELVLLPVWVLPVRYHPKKPPVRLVINGQTGAVAGKVPVSWVKWVLLVAAVLLPIVACCLAVAILGQR